jgi:glycosyltransferase involved in cell wall biosynthesis
MKILLLAPQPFFQERGTPIAVRMLAEALARRGHSVDLLTFPGGEDVPLPPGVRLRRAPGLRGVRPGFSLRKLVNDVLLAGTAWRLARRERYDAYHGVEEAVFIADLLARFRPAPVVYDMDSSLSEQMADKSAWFRVFFPALRWAERRALRRATVVLPVCQALADSARPYTRVDPVVMRDPPPSPPASDADAQAARHRFAPPGLLFLYAGNLESYQGIDLLLEAFARVLPLHPDARLVVVGGRADDISRNRARAAALGLSSSVQFTGPRPLAELGPLLAAADILVSPRLQGQNTPMKIYSYMQAGRAIVATDILSHTQVLDPTCAWLAPARAETFGAALCAAAAAPEERRRRAAAACAKCAAEFGRPAYERAVDRLLDAVATARGRLR